MLHNKVVLSALVAAALPAAFATVPIYYQCGEYSIEFDIGGF
jgi:hypothetical protein